MIVLINWLKNSLNEKKKFGDNLSENINLSNYSWFNLGGNAEYFFKAKNIEHLSDFLKEANKNKLKGNRKPSGFAVPGKISSELCKFMNKPDGYEAARTEVTKYIIKYIQENNLQNPENKREILPDNELKQLLNNKKEPVTYFSIQRLMNPHFV